MRMETVFRPASIRGSSTFLRNDIHESTERHSCSGKMVIPREITRLLQGKNHHNAFGNVDKNEENSNASVERRLLSNDEKGNT